MNGWKLVRWILIVSIAAFGALYFNNGFTELATRLCIRLSAKISASLFSLAFAASSLHYFFKRPWTTWILTNRKYLGISFAIVHLMHLGFLGILHLYFHPIFEVAATSSLIGGGLAYLFLALMLATSFERFSKMITHRQWILLHTIGGYWIWFIFAKSYWKRVMIEMEYLPLLLLFAVVLILRIGKVIFKQKKA